MTTKPMTTTTTAPKRTRKPKIKLQTTEPPPTTPTPEPPHPAPLPPPPPTPPTLPEPDPMPPPGPVARMRHATASPAQRRGAELVRFLRIHVKRPYGPRGEAANIALAREVAHLARIELGEVKE